MANETSLTIVGNLSADPDLRYTNSNVPYCTFTIASTPSVFNSNTNSWDNGTTVWMRCTAWREIAENIHKSLTKGSRVIAQGKLTANEWQTKDGENRRENQLTITDIGPSLFRAVAHVDKTVNNSSVMSSASSSNKTSQNEAVVSAASSNNANVDPFESQNANSDTNSELEQPF